MLGKWTDAAMPRTMIAARMEHDDPATAGTRPLHRLNKGGACPVCAHGLSGPLSTDAQMPDPTEKPTRASLVHRR